MRRKESFALPSSGEDEKCFSKNCLILQLVEERLLSIGLSGFAGICAFTETAEKDLLIPLRQPANSQLNQQKLYLLPAR